MLMKKQIAIVSYSHEILPIFCLASVTFFLMLQIESKYKGPYYAAMAWLKKTFSSNAKVDHIDVYNLPNSVCRS